MTDIVFRFHDLYLYRLQHHIFTDFLEMTNHYITKYLMPEKDDKITNFHQFGFYKERIFDLVGISGVCADQRCNLDPRIYLR